MHHHPTRGALIATGTAPGPAVGLDETKKHLRVDFTDDDSLIASHIATATAVYDGPSGLLGRCLVNQAWIQEMGGFARDLCPGHGERRDHRRIDLPLAGVSAAAVTYVDAAGNTQTLSTAVYRLVSTGRLAAWLELKPFQIWPCTQWDNPAAVSIAFTSGFGTADTVPEAIKTAIKLRVTDLYAGTDVNCERADELAFMYRRQPV